MQSAIAKLDRIKERLHGSQRHLVKDFFLNDPKEYV